MTTPGSETVAAGGTAGSVLTGAFSLASGIIHNPLGFGLTSYIFISTFINKTDGTAGAVVNGALAIGLTLGVNAMFPAFFTAGTATASAAGFAGAYPPGDPATQIMNHVQLKESTLRYNVLFGNDIPYNATGQDITQWSIAEVASTGKASGICQMIPSTLTETASSMNIPLSEKYTPGIQQSLCHELLDQRVLDPLKAGNLSISGAFDALQRTWVAPLDRDMMMHYLQQYKLSPGGP